MIAIHQAFALIDEQVGALAVTRQPLLASRGRVLAEAAVSQTDLPPFAQSAVDGYAVHSQNVAKAPVKLELSGTIAADAQSQRPKLKPGTAMRIYTGGMLPEGADTVVRQELTEPGRNVVTINEAVAENVDYRHQGEELLQGTELAAAGQRLTAGMIGSLANGGIAKLAVQPSPRISVLITGDEVTPAGKGLKPGQVYDANGPTIAATLADWGYERVKVRYVADTEAAVRKALKRAFKESDFVLTTGGVSVGDLDYIPAVTEKLGAERVFWKVAQKPGKPLYFAMQGNVPLLGLPGNPAAVLVNLHVFARRILDRLEAAATLAPSWRSGQLARAIRPDSKRDRWVRVTVTQDSDDRILLEPLGHQASHMMSNLSEAVGLAHLPSADSELPAGSKLQWIPL